MFRRESLLRHLCCDAAAQGRGWQLNGGLCNEFAASKENGKTFAPNTPFELGGHEPEDKNNKEPMSIASGERKDEGLAACHTRDAAMFLVGEAAIMEVLNKVIPEGGAEVPKAVVEAFSSVALGVQGALNGVQGRGDGDSTSSYSLSRSSDQQVTCVSSRKRPRPALKEDSVVQQPPEDEAELFGRVLAHHMRNCPTHMVLQMQIAMLETVSRFTS